MSDPKFQDPKKYLKEKLSELQQKVSELSAAVIKHDERINYMHDQVWEFSDASLEKKKGIFQHIEGCSFVILPLCQRIHDLISISRRIGTDIKTTLASDRYGIKNKEKYHNLLHKQDNVFAPIWQAESKIYDTEKFVKDLVNELRDHTPKS